jgi:hypothetical protein
MYDISPLDQLEERGIWGKIAIRALFLVAPLTLTVFVLAGFFYYLVFVFKWFFCTE